MSRKDLVYSAGGIVYDTAGRVLLIRRELGGLGIPKGHVEPGESTEQAAIRELFEETGYRCTIVKHLGHLQRKSLEEDGRLADKQIDLFQMRIVGGELGGTDEDALWVTYDEALEGLHHPEERAFLAAYGPDSLGS